MATAGAIRAGKAFIRLFLDDSQMKRQARGLRNLVSKELGGLTRVGIAGAGLAGLALGLKAFLQPAIEATKAGKEFQEAAQQMATSWRNLQIELGKNVLPAVTLAVQGLNRALSGGPKKGTMEALIEERAAIQQRQRQRPAAFESGFFAIFNAFRGGRREADTKRLAQIEREMTQQTIRAINLTEMARETLAEADVEVARNFVQMMNERDFGRGVARLGKRLAQNLADSVADGLGRIPAALRAARTFRELFTPDKKNLPPALRFTGASVFGGRQAQQLFDPVVTVQKEQVQEQKKTTQGIVKLQEMVGDVTRAITAGLGFR